MLIVMRHGASDEEVRRVVAVIEELGYHARTMPGAQRVAVGLVGNDGRVDASRLEGLTKEPAYGTPIIVSEATLAGVNPRPFARELGEVKVKGKAEAVKIFALTAKGETKMPYNV